MGGKTYQQLSLNLFLTEDEQIKLIDEAESRQFSAFSFAQEEIDHFLMLGSNRTNSRMAIATEFMKQKSVDDLAQFLKETYNGGYGIKENGRSISAWYAEDGIHLAMGRSARYTKSAQVIPWTEAAERIGQLLVSVLPIARTIRRMRQRPTTASLSVPMNVTPKLRTKNCGIVSS